MVFRPEPALPAHMMQTYAIRRPLPTHWRRASCAEVRCAGHVQGWVTYVNVNSDLGRRQAEYLRSKAHGLHYTEKKGEVEGGVEFHFPAGQRCFRQDEHKVPLERDPLFVVQGGDHRGNPRGTHRTHVRPEDWVEDFAEHQDDLYQATA